MNYSWRWNIGNVRDISNIGQPEKTPFPIIYVLPTEEIYIHWTAFWLFRWNVHVRPERFCWYTSRLANCFASMCQFFLKKFSEAIGEPTNNLTSATLPRIFMSVCLSILMYLVNDMTNFKYSFTIIIAPITTRPVKIFEFMQLVCTLYFLEKNFSSNLEMFLSIFDWFRIKIWWYNLDSLL